MTKVFQINRYLHFAIIGILGIAMCSCSDDDEAIMPSNQEEEYTADAQPTIDEVKTLFSGKVAILQPNADEVMSYIGKRLINTSSVLTDDADVVIIDETGATTFLNDADQYSELSRVWNKNKVVTFINPGANAVALQHKLQGVENDVEVQTNINEYIESLGDISVYAVRADGTSLFIEKVGAASTGEGTVVSISEEGESEEIIEPTECDYSEPTDYEKGRAGENFAEWLTDNALIGDQPDIAFSRSSSSEYNPVPVTKTFHHSITVNHEWINNYDDDAKGPKNQKIDAKSVITIYGSYSPDFDCDVYDVNVYQEYPANKVYFENKVVKSPAAYKYKYTGSCYSGPTVQLSLNGIDKSSNVELEEIAPLPETNGEYRTTHSPMTISLGGSLQAKVSSKGLEGTAGFSCGITLPSTTVQFSHKEMPIKFWNTDDKAKWQYTTDYKIYKHTWGSNGRFIDVPDICHSFCHTDQAVTFVVNNTKNYGDKQLSLNYDVQYGTYAEYCRVWSTKYRRYSYPFSEKNIALPSVNRFFEKYTPYHIAKYSGNADTADWTYMNNLLKDNVNYRALCDEALKVGATTDAGLDVNATKIWREALTALVKQYNGTKTGSMYVVALAKSDGSHLPLGLVIKDGVWSITENVDAVPYPAE